MPASTGAQEFRRPFEAQRRRQREADAFPPKTLANGSLKRVQDFLKASLVRFRLLVHPV